MPIIHANKGQWQNCLHQEKLSLILNLSAFRCFIKANIKGHTVENWKMSLKKHPFCTNVAKNHLTNAILNKEGSYFIQWHSRVCFTDSENFGLWKGHILEWLAFKCMVPIISAQVFSDSMCLLANNLCLLLDRY